MKWIYFYRNGIQTDCCLFQTEYYFLWLNFVPFSVIIGANCSSKLNFLHKIRVMPFSFWELIDESHTEWIISQRYFSVYPYAAREQMSRGTIYTELKLNIFCILKMKCQLWKCAYFRTFNTLWQDWQWAKDKRWFLIVLVIKFTQASIDSL